MIDDFSQDGTSEVVSSYRDPRIKYFRLEENHGSDSFPKNLGISKAQGELIAFLDDDDRYRPDALKILSKYLEHSGADMVYGDYLISEKGETKPGWSIDFNVQLLTRMNYIAMPVAMVKKEVLLEVGGFDENVPKFKDWNLWLRIQKRGYRILHVPIITTEVFPQEKSISTKYETEVDKEGHYLPTFFNAADAKIYPDKTCIGKRKPLRAAVFTFVMDRLDYTKKMASRMTETAGYPFDWFVIDNGSVDGTDEWFKDRARRDAGGKVFYHRNEKNVGIAKAWNQAADLIAGKMAAPQRTDYDILIKIDNDCEMMSEGWLKEMIEIFERNRMVVLSPYVEGLEDSPGGVLRQRSGKDPYVLINDRVLGVVPNLGGICFAAPRELYKDFRFEASSFYAGNKDYMLSIYARQNGYTLFYMEELRCYHIDGTLGQQKRYPDYFAEKKELDAKKYDASKD